MTRLPVMRFVLFATLAAVLVALAPQARANPGVQGGAALQPGPFTLNRVDGSTLDGIELDGAPYGVMFGFTHCPDVCPTALAELTSALKASPNLPQGFKVYFIATDVARDTPKELGAYLGAFDPRIVGLTGTAEQMAEATLAFGAVARRKDFSNGDYTIEHTAALFLVDENGLIADRVSFKETSDEMAKRIAAVAGR